MISQHPEVEAKVISELDGLGLLASAERPDPRPLEHADLQDLKYILQAIKVRAALPARADPARLPSPVPPSFPRDLPRLAVHCFLERDIPPQEMIVQQHAVSCSCADFQTWVEDTFEGCCMWYCRFGHRLKCQVSMAAALCQSAPSTIRRDRGNVFCGTLTYKILVAHHR